MQPDTSAEIIPPTEGQSRKPRRKFVRRLTFVVVLAAIIITVAFWISSGSEPEYQGIALSSWLYRYDNNVDSEPQRDEALQAIHQIGSDAVPFLIRWLNVSDSKLKLSAISLLQKQSLIRFDFSDAETLHRRSLDVFELIGPEGKSAIPDLQRMILNQPAARDEALQALCLIGPNAFPILITDLTHENAEIRAAAGNTIVESYLSPLPRGPAVDLKLSTSFLSRLLQDSEEDVRLAAIVQLSGGRQTKPIQPDIVVPILIRELDSTNEVERVQAALALKRFGPAARASVPRLMLAAADDDHTIQVISLEALWKIDPVAAAKVTTK